MTNKKYAIECNNLSKTYSSGTKALCDVNLKLESGKIHVIIGPNGAGKTTFLRIATTEMANTQGNMNILGFDVIKRKDDILRLIGVMPQQALLYKQLTTWEHVYFFTMLKGFSKNQSKLETERVLTMLNLLDKKDVELDALSGGMVNLVNLAQSIAGNPEILFLDEPTTGIDPVRRKTIWSYLKKRAEGKTIIITTQYLDEAHELADNIVMFNKGKVIHEGDVNSTIAKLDYEIKVEMPKNSETLLMLNSIEKKYFVEEDDKLILWIKDAKKFFQHMSNSNVVNLANIKIHRPMLEEAYLNIINNEFTKGGD